MNITLDILVIIIVAVFAFLGYKKGIVRTSISIAGTILSSALSMILSSPIAEALYYGGFKNAIIENVNDASTLLKRSGTGSLLEKLMETLPDYVVNSLPGFNITQPQLAAAAANSPQVVEELLRPIVISFLSMIVSIILFIIISIIVKLVARFIAYRIDDWSFGTVDSFLGAVIGIIEGFVLVLMIAFVVRIAVPHLKHVPNIISNKSISQSTVFKGVYDSPILSAFLSNTESPNTEAVE